jgi:hypothetical protein
MNKDKSTKESTKERFEFEIKEDPIKKSANFVYNQFSNAFKKVGSELASLATGPLNDMNAMASSFADVDVTSWGSLAGIMTEISKTTKQSIADARTWRQDMIKIYRTVSQSAEGHTKIYSTFAKTRDIMSDNLLQWKEWGDYTDGTKLAVSLMKNTIAEASQLSNLLLLNWHKQNKMLALSNDEASEWAGLLMRSGMSLEESVKFQKEVFVGITKIYGNEALTSKIVKDVAKSKWAINLATAKNLTQLSALAAKAHAWGSTIDEIYETTHKLGKAEAAINAARELQIAFRVQINARHMQYLAQTGKEYQLQQMLVDKANESVVKMGGNFDKLALAQRQILANLISGGDIQKARLMLLGEEATKTQKVLSTEEQMAETMSKMLEMQTAQRDEFANWDTWVRSVKKNVFEAWKGSLDFIFGAQSGIRNEMDMSYEFEVKRYELYKNFLTPIIEKIGNVFRKNNTSLIGSKGILDSIAGIAAALGSKFADLGIFVIDFWLGNMNGFSNFTDRIKDFDIEPIGDLLTKSLQKFVTFVTGDRFWDILDTIKNAFVVLGEAVVLVGSFIIDIVENPLTSFLKVATAIGTFFAVGWIASAIAFKLGAKIVGKSIASIGRMATTGIVGLLGLAAVIASVGVAAAGIGALINAWRGEPTEDKDIILARLNVEKARVLGKYGNEAFKTMGESFKIVDAVLEKPVFSKLLNTISEGKALKIEFGLDTVNGIKTSISNIDELSDKIAEKIAENLFITDRRGNYVAGNDRTLPTFNMAKT